MESESIPVELRRDSHNYAKVAEEIAKMERRIFPEHESLCGCFEQELNKENTGLLYTQVNEEVVGYLMFSCSSSLCASITELAVKENFRKQGYGEALVKAGIERCRARKVQRVSLHVDPGRTPAISLYKKIGFQVDTLLKGYYSPDRDAFRMYLEFDSHY